MHFIVGTAGHVDHGKTSLIRALTGIETDRLREEKERGLSIVPGFAHLQLPPTEYSPAGRTVGIVDVPGHERFLKNMLTGASGVAIAILVIAADEGVMPQTREHLRVLELLEIKRGVIALTKVDLVAEDWRAMIKEDVVSKLQSARFAHAPLVEVSATRGEGLDELKAVIAQLCDDLESTHPSLLIPHPFRLPIDRAFSSEGFGTVVTGSLLDGEVSVGETVDVWRSGASTPAPSRVRGLEVHGQSVEKAFAGQRVAVNLTGVSLDEDLRGGVLAASGTLRATDIIEAKIEVLREASRALKDDAIVRVHRGAAEIGARVLLYDCAKLGQGESGFARLRLDAPLPVVRGDRVILRDVSTERVLGGALVLEPSRLPRTLVLEVLSQIEIALLEGDTALANFLSLRAGAAGLTENALKFELHRSDIDEVLKTLREKGFLWRNGEVLLHIEIARQIKEHVLDALQTFHVNEPLQNAMPRESLRAKLPSSLSPNTLDALLDELASDKKIEFTSDGVRLFAQRAAFSEEEQQMVERIDKTCYDAAWQPPTIDELANQFPKPALARKLIFNSVQSGVLIRIADYVFHSQRIQEAEEKMRDHLANQSTLSVADARELLNSSRKWLVPLLEYFDKRGLTRREGDARVLR